MRREEPHREWSWEVTVPAAIDRVWALACTVGGPWDEISPDRPWAEVLWPGDADGLGTVILEWARDPSADLWLLTIVVRVEPPRLYATKTISVEPFGVLMQEGEHTFADLGAEGTRVTGNTRVRFIRVRPRRRKRALREMRAYEESYGPAVWSRAAGWLEAHPDFPPGADRAG